MKNENKVENLNDNEVSEVSGGGSEIEKLKDRRIPSELINDINPIFREKTCRVCGRTVIVRYDRPSMKDCPDCICGVCEMEKWIKERKAKTQ